MEASVPTSHAALSGSRTCNTFDQSFSTASAFSLPPLVQICANSLGPEWGENGYFRIIRGVNANDIETNIVGAWGKVTGDVMLRRLLAENRRRRLKARGEGRSLRRLRHLNRRRRRRRHHRGEKKLRSLETGRRRDRNGRRERRRERKGRRRNRNSPSTSSASRRSVKNEQETTRKSSRDSGRRRRRTRDDDNDAAGVGRRLSTKAATWREVIGAL